MIKPPTQEDWYFIENIEQIDSPALVIFPDRIESNITEMIKAVGGDVNRLRPHVKTHKMKEVVQLQLDQGIWKYKCATIAEAEMLGELEVQDVLIAYQPVGPKIQRVRELCRKFPQTRFSVLVDNQHAASRVAEVFSNDGESLAVYLDIDVGMHRTGIAPHQATDLFSFCKQTKGIQPVGLHAYDGHVHQNAVKERKTSVANVFVQVDQLTNKINQDIEVVVSGSPSFPYHAQRNIYTCSPGTSLLWDWRYSNMCEDQSFKHAAIVIARVISTPGDKNVCVDLGHKSIASEMPFPRVHFLNLSGAKQIKHSEEHLVLELKDNSDVNVGDVLYGVPMHICPTVALHENAHVVKDQQAVEAWNVIARKRKITV